MHRLFSALLALLVLTTSVGLTVQQRICRSSGRVTASVIFSPPTGTCPTSEAAVHDSVAQLSGACCDLSAHFHKLDTLSPDLAWAKQILSPFVALAPPRFCYQLVAPGRRPALTARWHATDSSPPARSGRALLAFVCTLVV